MTWAEKHAEALDGAAVQLLQHGLPRLIRTAGDISECACEGCQQARALIAAKAEVKRLEKVAEAARSLLEIHDNLEFSQELTKALRTYDALQGGEGK